MPPEIPRRPELTAERPAKASSRGRYFIVLFSGFSLLLFLAFVSLFYAGFAIVVALAALLISFHYVVWGWWLGRVIHEAESSDTDVDT